MHPAVSEVVFEVEFAAGCGQGLAQRGGLLGLADPDLQPALLFVPGNGLSGILAVIGDGAVERLEVRMFPAHDALQGQPGFIEHDAVVNFHGAPDGRRGAFQHDSQCEHPAQWYHVWHGYDSTDAGRPTLPASYLIDA